MRLLKIAVMLKEILQKEKKSRIKMAFLQTNKLNRNRTKEHNFSYLSGGRDHCNNLEQIRNT